MKNTPSSRPEKPERDLDEATAIDFGQPRAPAHVDSRDGQETLIWEGAAQLAELEGQIAHEDKTRMLLTDGVEELPRTLDAPQTFVDPRVWFLGRSFGGFRIVCELASGGMATVFLGRKEGPSRVSKHAAIKIVHPHLVAERDFIHMFLDEARIAACLHHPNVCPVLDFGEAEGTYYLAMEYLLGETWSGVRVALALHPDGQVLLPTITAHVLAQACEGLHAAHEAADDQGQLLHVVHRDVSPQNIFVAYDGTVRVLDFGVASAANRITSTRDGILKGRLAYMSPEQMAAEPVGRAADIWAMGVVLREALEGKRLFRRASDAETMFAVTSEPLPPWTVEVAPGLAAIVERALQRAPEARYATAHEMAQELTRFTSSQRRAVSSSALSTWMHEQFEIQIEQKRALLQLPIPTPRASPTPSIMIGSLALSDHEPSSLGSGAESMGETSSALLDNGGTAHVQAAKGWRRTPRWFNPSALLALSCLGAFTGVILGRVLRDSGPREARAPAASHAAPSPASREKTSPTAPTVTPLADERTHADPKLDARGSARQQHREHADSHRARVREEASEDEPALKDTAQEAGTLLVAFEGGWAEVYLAGKLLGTTPGRFELPAGRHTLIIKPFGADASLKRRVDVQPAAVTKLFLSASEQ
jgi:serine/threonine-protein kinase